MAETLSFSDLAVEIKICLETGLINYFFSQHPQTNNFSEITGFLIAPFQHLQKLQPALGCNGRAGIHKSQLAGSAARVPACPCSAARSSVTPLSAWSEGGDITVLTHSLSILASPAGTGFLGLWGGTEVFASSVV